MKKYFTREQKEEAKSKTLVQTAYILLRHIYSGNAPFTPDTIEYKVLDSAVGRIDKLVDLFRIKAVKKIIPEGSSLRIIAQDFLYNCRTGNDDEISFSLK